MDQRRARGLRNRHALIHAAIELFATQGYETTTVEQISAAAGVAPRTFFHHFATKDDILFDGYADRLQEATRRFRAARSKSLWDALAEASSAVAEAIIEQPEIFVVRANMYHNVPSLRATMLRINEDWIDQLTAEVARWLNSNGETDLRPRLAASLTNSANRAAIDVWVAGGGQGNLTELMAEAIELVRPSIVAIERTAATRGGQRVG
ncbi:TetR/AcrR family transcriptional regulator [Mycobacterium mantenii]|uniref:TetR family transcriptional regulator n=1 Tax=Mycobacterium mantenii TaxID=560555 RepID=A0A1A2TPB3_MYCNT|nr:TetR/AcrR family transcriptional regulator [Mycobacterium mantenii]OBH41916.1 TetR family transcriptional regulator [Mycobacterium mantenii]OBH53818.1 TetR family transcriptional regulator [Mycobacterium mantenii]OBH74060.1 TetR family transcriptional regulator [Mycobacterium mantenii]OBH78221.1 TetR family transcriptional regulator [Mycobacterium mantenii]